MSISINAVYRGPAVEGASKRVEYYHYYVLPTFQKKRAVNG